MQNLRSFLIGLCCIVFMTACASTSQVRDAGTIAGATQSQSQSESRPVYVLGAQDQLRVTVFGEPELSGEFVIGSNGTVSLPLIGEVSAAGLTVTEFQGTTERLLGDGYLLDPKVSAEVLNYRPFFILGEVNSPGQYQYANGLTVINAIATAGGYTYRGNSRDVMIKGADDRTEVRVKLSADLLVRPGDTIRVLERIF